VYKMSCRNSGAEISRVIIDEENNSMEVIVPDDHLSIAIGKKGQNVRLASKLTQWRLDVTSESRYSEAMQNGYNSLVSLPGVGISLADALYEKGFFSAEELINASMEDLIQIRGIGEEKAMKLIEAAKTYTENLYTEAETPKESFADEGAVGDEVSTVSDVQKVSKEGEIDDASEKAPLSDEIETDQNIT